MLDTTTKRNLINLSALDLLIHSPARLTIVYLLNKINTLDFIQLMKHTDFSWGNLSTHLSKLEDGGYVSITKTFNDKRPYTLISLTDTGRQAFIFWCRSIIGVLPGAVVSDFLSAGGQLEAADPEAQTSPRTDQQEEQLIDRLFPRDQHRLDKTLLPIKEFNKL